MQPPAPLMKPEDGFLALQGAQAVSYADAGAVIIPFGLEASVSYGGWHGAWPSGDDCGEP